MSGLSLSLLGPFGAAVGDRPLNKFRTNRVQALLIYLATENVSAANQHRREALMELLWPGLPQKSAQVNLRQTLYHLRKGVPEMPAADGGEPVPFLLSDRQSIQLNPAYPITLDVAEFGRLLDVSREQWPQAVALYRGDFLADFYLPDAASFEAWAAARRAAFQRQMLAALDTLTARALERRAFEAAEGYARRQLEIDGLRESAHRQLMQRYARDGQQAEALRQYQECLRLLAEELGIQPAQETNAFYEAIKAGRALEAALPTPAPIPACPYLGLSAFRESDAPFFFGQESFTQRLVAAAAARAMVAVIGPSGSGKSSVVHAGLLPQLGEQEHLLSATFRPGSEPFRALAAALVPMLEPEMSETDRLLETRKLAEVLGDEALPLADVVTRILQKHSGAERLLLVGDQFEELYTLCPEPALRNRFLECLLQASAIVRSQSEAGFTFVLTLRADFLGPALAYRPFADALQDAYLMLGPMTRAELARAIEKPAQLQGVTFEAGLVERFLDDLGAAPGNLPLLEFALTTLWDRQTDGQLNHAAYEAIGRVEGGLARYAEEFYAQLDPGARERARHVFIQMVRPGEGTEDTRRLATRAELGEENWGLVQRMADARLVVTGSDASEQETVEVVHEALIRGWERLRTWMSADRAFRSWQERLRAALGQWEASKRDEGALLRGAPLAEAQGWLAERESELSQSDKGLIHASVTLRERRRMERERRRRRITLGLAAGFIVAIILTLFAFNQSRIAASQSAVAERRAVEAHSLALAAAAQLALTDNLPVLALGLAVEANRIDDPPLEVQSVLYQAAYARERNHLAGDFEAVHSVAFSPDGRTALYGGTLASVSNLGGSTVPSDTSLVLWDITTQEILWRFEAPAGVESVAFSPDGQTALTGLRDATLILWDIETGQQIRRLQGHAGRVWSVDFSPDGQRALSGSADRTMLLWNIETGEVIRRFEGFEKVVRDVAFSLDGHAALVGLGSELVGHLARTSP